MARMAGVEDSILEHPEADALSKLWGNPREAAIGYPGLSHFRCLAGAA
jgi:hypothetical protein